MWWDTCSRSIWNNVSDTHNFHHFLLHPCTHKMKLRALLDLRFILHSFTSSPWFQVLHTVYQYLHLWKMKFQHHLWDLALTVFHLYLSVNLNALFRMLHTVGGHLILYCAKCSKGLVIQISWGMHFSVFCFFVEWPSWSPVYDTELSVTFWDH